MKFDALKIQPGAAMQAQAFGEGIRARHEVRFIGLVKDKSVLVTLPFHEGQALWLTPGKVFVLRGFDGIHAYAFNTQVIRARTNPFPYVHFSWPLEIECQTVRKSRRVTISLPAHVVLPDNNAVEVVMLDLSVSGSMLNSATPLGEVDGHARIEFAVNFDGTITTLKFSAVIHNVQKKPDGTGFYIGVGFKEVAQNERLILHYFIDSVAQDAR